MHIIYNLKLTHLILYFHINHYYTDLEISFKELNRVLKKDGKLIILENISDNLIFKYYRFIKYKLQKKIY